MSKLLAAAALTGFALFTSFTPATAQEEACTAKGVSLKETKELNSIIKKSEQLIEIASELEDREISDRVIEKLKEDIASNQSQLQSINACSQEITEDGDS